MPISASGRLLSLQQLQRRLDRLRQLQNRLRLPPGHFEALGRRYYLPLRTEHAQSLKRVSPRLLGYLAGFFDGDGCVTPCTDKSGIRLSVSQAESHGVVLLLFRNIFGGSIVRLRHAGGLCRPSLQWHLVGGTAQQVATNLSASAVCKRTQLAIAGSWPQEPSLRCEAAARMKLLEQEAPAEATCPSWQYLTGFFDAEGCIVLMYPAYLRLEIKQKFLPVLRSIQGFLARHGVDCIVREKQSHGLLVVRNTENCKFVLAKLIRSGLRVKREAARLAIQVCAGDFFIIRSNLRRLVGNQGHDKRLSIDGLVRAAGIKQIQARLRCLTGKQHSHLERSELESQLLVLQKDHKLKCGQERLLRIRSDIRSFISVGATVPASPR
ncbi:USP [Symbiodinium necroappetens]|uniref:USP protein n=1 Tax=Symbiodinium necroappetens TaxID=1628268 RepID=A0A813C9R4_9DINO|nr:USP [Symbiodinium sp. CCMP2456]CAE7939277.1 USP [Symbiodinium necroappetens]